MIEMGTEIETLLLEIDNRGRRKERLKEISKSLGEGRKVSDFRFDQIYPPSIRKLSNVHWTPVEVAIRATGLLVTNEASRILDVGSGCGKFCIVAALTSKAQFVGVEQRETLIKVSRMGAEITQASGASFIHGDMIDLDWSQFTGFYFFNPFYENLGSSVRIDETVPFGFSLHAEQVRVVQRKLRLAEIGTRVVTYHGFGGEFPAGYELVKKERFGWAHLELWTKIWHAPMVNEYLGPT